MAEVKWIKIVTDIFDDEKILLIESLPDADSIIVCWFKLLCLAGKQNNSGVLMLNERVAYTDEMLATVFRRPLQTVRLALEVFEQFGMVEIINGAITIPNWEKHQNVEGMDKIREQTRARVAEYRERQRKLPELCNVTSNVTVTQGNALEEDIEEEKDKDKKKGSGKKFIPPTLEEVKTYIAEKGYHVDAEYFWKYYDTSKWKRRDGTPVLNWKQTLITWEKKDSEKQEQNQNFQSKKKYVTAAEYVPPKPKSVDDIWKLVDQI